MPSVISLIKKHDIGSLMSTDELTFVYPFLVSGSIDKRLQEELRRFMMVQYLSQIKITNAISVTTNLANPKKASTAPRVDPSKFAGDTRVPRRVGSEAEYMSSLSNVREDISVDLTKQEYIDKFRNMLQHLVKTEPRFKDLDPIITTLTLENLLTIPVIAASKVLNISNDVLYWILFAALGQRIQLTSSSNMSRIESVLRAIPKDSYKELLDPDFIKQVEHNNHMREKDLIESRRLNSLKMNNVDAYLKGLNDPLDRGFYAFKRVLDINAWDQETGIKSSIDATLSASAVSTMGSNQAVISNAMALFTSILSNQILHILQSTLHAIVSTDEINIPLIISNISRGITDLTSSLFDNMMLGLTNSIQTQSIDSSDVLFSLLEKSCKANSNINASGLISKLGEVSFSIRGDTNSLAEFMSGLIKLSSVATPLTSTIAGFISEIIKFSNGQTLTGTNIDSNKIIDGYTKSIDFLILNELKKNGIIDAANKLESKRFSILTGNLDGSKFVNNISTSLSEITTFLSLFTFYSYFCEFTGELAAEVNIKRQGVMSFPNYCMVLPLDLLRPIYAVLSAKSFRDVVENSKDFDSSLNAVGNISDNKIISTVMTKLGIRNIIVIDGNQVYYKWMFSHSIQRISTSTLSSYNRSQSEFLKAY